MEQIKAYGVLNATNPLGPLQISRRYPGANDVAIDIAYCGVCHFDLIINTVSVKLDWGAYLGLLKRDGSMVLLGVPSDAPQVHAFPLIMARRSLAGSLIGGIKETQEMLDFCGKHNITSDIELIPIGKINEAYERVIKADVKYRFVIDIASLI